MWEGTCRLRLPCGSPTYPFPARLRSLVFAVKSGTSRHGLELYGRRPALRWVPHSATASPSQGGVFTSWPLPIVKFPNLLSLDHVSGTDVHIASARMDSPCVVIFSLEQKCYLRDSTGNSFESPYPQTQSSRHKKTYRRPPALKAIPFSLDHEIARGKKMTTKQTACSTLVFSFIRISYQFRATLSSQQPLNSERQNWKQNITST